jgi:hypothetical protein
VFDYEHEFKIETVPQRVAHATFQLDETGVNGNSFHAQLAESGRPSVVRARFKSPLAHQYDPRPDLGLYGIRGRFRGIDLGPSVLIPQSNRPTSSTLTGSPACCPRSDLSERLARRTWQKSGRADTHAKNCPGALRRPVGVHLGA